MIRRIRARGEDVRKYILEHLEKHPRDLAKVVAEHFGITRQAISKHLKRLSADHAIVESGQTRNRTYKLATLAEWDRAYEVTPTLAEDIVWRDDVSKVIGDMPENVLALWHYGFTEMFNNALDHSVGTTIYVAIRRNAVATEMVVKDNGVGIFKKIQAEFGLLDERHAILELAKGKLTTDPKRHTGEGIFFSSRMFDQFDILSGAVFFTHKFEDADDWILERDKPGATGTFAWMKLNNHTSRTTTKIFDQYSSGDEYGFTKTVVPVDLARYGNENLISRSQAKRLLARVELFKKVLFDFSDVSTIGQAFADEIFRVFATSHPGIELVPIHTNSDVKKVIDRARFAGSQGSEKT
jgi:anti-sigma regulatory factor (Ser/Thr protein kinase)/DNA-binding transcriptional ArsR family regulator